MLILALAYPRTIEYGWSHFSARWVDIAFNRELASRPKSPSTDRTNGVKVRRCFKQLLTYLRFFCCSCFANASSGVSSNEDALSVSVILTSTMQSVPGDQTFFTSKSPRSSEGRVGCGGVLEFVVESEGESSVFGCLI